MSSIEPLEQKERHQPKNVNILHKNRLGLQDKIAVTLTTAVGTMYAVYFFAIITVSWMLWQTYFAKQPFDPYPFAFLLFLGSVIQLLLMPLIMVGQNIQGKHAEIRAEEEFKTTRSIYKDMETILMRLDEQDKAIRQQTNLLDELISKR